MEIQGCIECGQRIVVADTYEHYTESPYWWGRGGYLYCLACWLGVGPNDLPGVDADLPEVDATPNDPPGVDGA